MPIGSVTVNNDESVTGSGDAYTLYNATVGFAVDLSGLAVPVLGATSSPYRPERPVAASDVDAVKAARLALLRQHATTCTVIANHGSGGGATQPAIEFGLDALLMQQTPADVNGPAQTSGVSFYIRPGANLNLTGVRFYWAGTANQVVKTVLYSSAGAVLKSQNVTTAGAGIYTSTFGSPLLFDNALNGVFQQAYTVSVWSTSDVRYTKIDKNAPAHQIIPARPFFGGRRIGWVNFSLWIGADAAPTSTANNEAYPVEPILVE